MTECSCFNKCCSHNETSIEEIEEITRTGHKFSFSRKSCDNCGKWLGDKLL